jgi:hypothetical protein
MTDHQKIKELKNKIDGYKIKLRDEEEIKKREEIKYRIKIEEIKIRIERLK